MTRTDSAFTLIELLVVMGILALLAALLLPALHRAKMKAQQAACLSHQRQINLDFRLHLDDTSPRLDQTEIEDWRVWNGSGEDAAWDGQHWVMHTSKSWLCPSAPLRDPGTSMPNFWSWRVLFGSVQSAWGEGGTLALIAGRWRVGSYGINWWLFDAAWTFPTRESLQFVINPGDFLNDNDITHPELTPVLGDSMFGRVCASASDPPPADLAGTWWSVHPVEWTVDLRAFVIPRHGSRPNPVPTDWPADKTLPGAVNVSFFDGHGELVKLDRLWQLYWHKDYQPPAKRPGLP